MKKNSISSNILLITLTPIAVSSVICSCSKKQTLSKIETSRKPNVILFVADDHGTDALGCYGNNVIQTPNLDALAKEGVKFSQAYCTSASSAASRSVILTGKYGHATGSYGHVHDYHHFSTFDTIPSLPKILEKNGYYTARIGKYHLAPETVYHFVDVFESNPRSTAEMADKVKGVFKSKKPFFLYFCTDDPHRGYPFQPKIWDMPNTFGNRPEGYPEIKTITYDPKDVIVPSFLPDTKQCREELAQYYQSISRIDQGFGRLMNDLKKSGKMDNTIVIYISDNGIAFPGAKTTTYEPGIKLPCIIKDPSIKEKNITNNAVISWVDLTPTILDMAGINGKQYGFHGRSFKKILGQKNPKGWDTMMASHTFHEITMYYPMRVIREGKYKLIWNIAYKLDYPFASDLWASSTWQSVYRNHQKYFGKRTVKNYLNRAEFELYDLEQDPDEIHNLALDKKYEKVFTNMKLDLKKKQLQTKDPWYIMWGHDSALQGTGVNL